MKPTRLSLATTLLLAVSAAGAGMALARPLPEQPASAEKPAGPKAKPKAKTPSQDEMMKAWQAYATPGESHKKLEKAAGTWNTKVRTWMDPSKPPEETEGTNVGTMVLGGRYLEEKYEGTMMGQPFHGVGLTGYDNYKKKYVGTWADSMGTGIMMMTGSFDKSGKVMTSWGTMDDPIMKKTVKVKSVTTIVDDDTHRFEMWNTGPGGKMVKSMEMVYTRKK